MDSDAFDAALVQLSTRLPAYFRRRVSDRALVEDLTQETLVRAFRSRKRLRDEACFDGWVFRIAHYTVVDYYRRQPLPRTSPASCRSGKPRGMEMCARC